MYQTILVDGKPVYYTSMVDYRHPKQVGCSGAGSGGDGLDKTRQAMAENIRFYQDLGYQVVKAEIERVCDTCNGSGQVRYGKRVIRYKRCPDCKGKDSRVIVETWIDLPKMAWID